MKKLHSLTNRYYSCLVLNLNKSAWTNTIKNTFVFCLALLLNVGVINSQTDIALNGGFETSDFTDWTQFPNGTQTVITTNPSEGMYCAELNNTTPASASIIKNANVGIGVAVGGQDVTISFDARGAFNAGGVAFAELFSEISGGGVSKSELLSGAPLSMNADPNIWTPFSFSTTLGPDVSGGVTLQLTATTGGDISSSAQVFYDNVKITLGSAPAAQEITVKVDVSEQAPVAGVNIAWWNGSGFDEYAASDEGGGVWSYVMTSSAPANLSTGVLRTYKWRIYYSGGGDAFENMQLLPGGGGLEHDIFQDVPANEPINTDYANYLDRGVMPDGSDWTAKTYYFNSFRQPGVSYTDLVVNESAGKNIVMDYNVNGWDPFHGPGTVDNGDGTYTAKVRSSVGFQYLWNDLTTLGQEDLLTCTNDGVTIDTDNSTYANRIHAAGVAEIDFFNTCPSTAGIDDVNSTSFSTYPNPSKDSWTVKTKNINISIIEVYDISGKSVLSLTPNNTEAKIDATTLAKGLYFAKINGSNTLKLIKN